MGRCWPLLALLLGVWSAPATVSATVPASIQMTRFQSASGFASGNLSGTALDGDQLVLAPGSLKGTWVSAPVQPGFGFTRLVSSWNASTPAAGQLSADVQVSTAEAGVSGWYQLGTWAADDASLQRASVDGQSDAVARVATDTLLAADDPFVSYSVRATLQRASSDDPSPSLALVGAEASNVTSTSETSASTPLGGDPVELAVPALAQEIHAHQYARWGGGGEAWCSPTSTEMVVEFWNRGPTAADLAWVDPGYVDPSVDFAARSTYDATYGGTGNWSFNVAYAARYGLETFVTQLRSLTEAEQFVRFGIPLVASIASRPGELDGFLFPGGTKGHLVVLAGFDGAGNPIVDDPAAPSDARVRRVYDRAQFERVWLRGSGGTVYVIHPADMPLPPVPTGQTANW
jgi:hypothetical protein